MAILDIDYRLLSRYYTILYFHFDIGTTIYMLSRNMECYDSTPDRIVISWCFSYVHRDSRRDDRQRVCASLGFLGHDSGLDVMVD